MSTLYEELGVQENATPDEIKKAYKRAAARAHPDREGGSDSRMVAVNAAWNVLGNPEKRAKYDRGEAPGGTEQSDEYKARDICLKLFAQLIEQAPEHEDLIRLARGNIRKNQEQIRGVISQMRAKIKNLEKRKKRLKFSGSGHNFLLQLIEDQVTQLTLSAAQAEANLALGNLAHDMLKDFAYEPEEPPRPEPPNGTTTFGVHGIRGGFIFG